MSALTAEVQLDDDRLVHPALWDLRVVLRNGGSTTIGFSTATLVGAVAFEVTAADGARVPLGPPPTPPEDLRPDAALDPGESLTLRFRGNDLFAEAPPPGSYRLRFAATPPPLEAPVTSPWVSFTS